MSTRLREPDRRLFTLVSEAAFENPFGARRNSLDAEISDGPGDDPGWTGRMLDKVGTRLAALAPHGHFDVRTYAAADRDLLEHTILFETFHRFLEPLDAFIAQQERATDPVLRVSFAADFLRSLVHRGFEAEHARRMFELFYQMRRAYLFIARGLVGRSQCMRQLREELWRTVFTHDIRRYERQLWNRMEDFSTILIGETGTGKGAAAAAVGASGFIPFDAKKSAFAHSYRESFVPIHLNEFPESLFESEIFGHRKGAFTGAVDNHEGALARCTPHGTVFFDEIGEATLPVQVKLLRVLQDRIYSPVGSREPRRFYGRILAATNRPLRELRARGAMRDDFFYRLCSNTIDMPPLRTRITQAPGELADLVEHLCERMTHANAESRELADHVLKVLERDLGPTYAFPGNVRELEQCVRRILITGRCAPDAGSGANPGELPQELATSLLTAEALVGQYCALLHARTGSYLEVARITGLDRRTVKKYVQRKHPG